MPHAKVLGKGYLSMLLSELLSRDKVRPHLMPNKVSFSVNNRHTRSRLQHFPDHKSTLVTLLPAATETESQYRVSPLIRNSAPGYLSMLLSEILPRDKVHSHPWQSTAAELVLIAI